MVLVFYQVFRAVVEFFSCLAFSIALLQLYRDRNRCLCSLDDWVTHNVFRKVALVASIVEIGANVDFLGVFGIYPAEVRIFFKTANLTILSSAMLTYVYYTAKSCFPFIFFSRLQVASKRLKIAVITFHFVGNVCYCLNAIFSNRVALIVINVVFASILFSTIVASLILLYRLRHLLEHSPVGTKKKELRRRMNKWRNFTVLFSLCIFIVLVQSLSELMLVIRNTGQPLLPLEQKNFVDPDRINTFGASEASLIVAGVVSIYLFIWRAWLTSDGESRMGSSAGNAKTNHSMDSVGSNTVDSSDRKSFDSRKRASYTGTTSSSTPSNVALMKSYSPLSSKVASPSVSPRQSLGRSSIVGKQLPNGPTRENLTPYGQPRHVAIPIRLASPVSAKSSVDQQFDPRKAKNSGKSMSGNNTSPAPTNSSSHATDDTSAKNQKGTNGDVFEIIAM